MKLFQFFKLLSFILVSTFVSNGDIIYTSEIVTVSDFVGSGFSGYVDGLGNQTMFEPRNGRYSFYMTKHKDDGLIFIDGNNQDRIRNISKDGVISTMNISNTGNKFELISSGTLNSVFIIGSPITGWPTYPWLGLIEKNYSVSKINTEINTAKDIQPTYGMCVDSKNNIYISASYKHRIYKVSANGVNEVFAGSGNNGNLNGSGVFSSFSFPFQIACDSLDNIYIWDSGNKLIRKIDKDKNVTTLCGRIGTGYNNDGPKESATFGYSSVEAMCCGPGGKIYISSGNLIRVIDQNGYVKTLAGGTESGYKNGTGRDSRFRDLSAIVSIGNNLFVAETAFPRIRKITIGAGSIKKPVDNISIKLSAGITINGTVGKKYTIESSSNGGKQWVGLTELDLTKSPYTWYDENSVGTNNLYRVFESP